MDNEQRKNARDEAMKKLKKDVMQAEGTMLEVVGEACSHLLQNYDARSDPHFGSDFVVLMGAGFFGHHKRTGQPALSTEFMAHGNLHVFSHVLAGFMQQEPAFASAIFHAIQVYAKDQCDEGGGVKFSL